jgi:hypothetical protein
MIDGMISVIDTDEKFKIINDAVGTRMKLARGLLEKLEISTILSDKINSKII